MMNHTNKSISLAIPAEAEFIDIVRLNLYGIASKMGFSFEEIEDMKVAVAEACNNVVLHAYEQDDRGSIYILMDMLEKGLQITVMDEGKSFNYERKAKEADSLHDKELSEINVGGLGIYLMQALMDDVQVFSEQGTQVILTKLLIPKGEEENEQEPSYLS